MLVIVLLQHYNEFRGIFTVTGHCDWRSNIKLTCYAAVGGIDQRQSQNKTDFSMQWGGNTAVHVAGASYNRTCISHNIMMLNLRIFLFNPFAPTFPF